MLSITELNRYRWDSYTGQYKEYVTLDMFRVLNWISYPPTGLPRVLESASWGRKLAMVKWAKAREQEEKELEREHVN